MIDFKPVKDARLKPGDLWPLCSVSRATASSWLNGHAQPHPLHEDRIAKIIDGIRRAVKAGLLPVPHNVMRDERRQYIQDAIEKARSNRAVLTP